ncbi:MAG TPA: ribonuclease H-like domain-containing protein [Vicinamibacterales bacterium]|nr:ribonuclease H-like domain-containing protein [Vicinamibacterales bacterium]
MATLADRLRSIVAPSSARSADSVDSSGQTGEVDLIGSGANDSSGADLVSSPHRRARGADLARSATSNAADVLGGEWRDDYLVVERKYSPGHRHGRIAIADAAPPVEGWSRLGLLGGGDSRCLFLDLETTGLAGGAGTYAFLVGLGWFESGGFRIRQFFLASYAAERMLLEAVRSIAHDRETVVTYNGKSFDLPVLETRFVLHRGETPFAGMPHVDMLHTARRLWRPSVADASSERDDEPGRHSPQVDHGRVGRSPQGEGGCRLIALEEALCGHAREGDVPGFEIPARYFHYVRSGDARQLEAVLEHNRLDLLSLALLTARAADLLEDGPASTRIAREALGLGQIYERGGLLTEACAAFGHAASCAHSDIVTRAEALRALAVVCRRQRRYEDAAAAWRRVVGLGGCPPAIAREASEALAVHHEHRSRDLQAARSFALDSLRMPGTPARRDALQHRLARLERKIGDRRLRPLFGEPASADRPW